MEPTATSPTTPEAGSGGRDGIGPRDIAVAKLGALLGFLVLLSTSYHLRTEVLALNRIRFSADDARADYELKRLQETYPERPPFLPEPCRLTGPRPAARSSIRCPWVSIR